MDHAVTVDLNVKIKENEKISFLECARELKKLWNVKVTLETVFEGNLKELEMRK